MSAVASCLMHLGLDGGDAMAKLYKTSGCQKKRGIAGPRTGCVQRVASVPAPRLRVHVCDDADARTAAPCMLDLDRFHTDPYPSEGCLSTMSTTCSSDEGEDSDAAPPREELLRLTTYDWFEDDVWDSAPRAVTFTATSGEGGSITEFCPPTSHQQVDDFQKFVANESFEDRCQGTSTAAIETLGAQIAIKGVQRDVSVDLCDVTERKTFHLQRAETEPDLKSFGRAEAEAREASPEMLPRLRLEHVLEASSTCSSDKVCCPSPATSLPLPSSVLPSTPRSEYLYVEADQAAVASYAGVSLQCEIIHDSPAHQAAVAGHVSAGRTSASPAEQLQLLAPVPSLRTVHGQSQNFMLARPPTQMMGMRAFDLTSDPDFKPALLHSGGGGANPMCGSNEILAGGAFGFCQGCPLPPPLRPPPVLPPPTERPAVPCQPPLLDTPAAKATETLNVWRQLTPLSPAVLGANCRRGEVVVLDAEMGYHVVWKVDSKRLKGDDKVAVSPQFEIGLWEATAFRIMIRPRTVHDSRGGACFRKSKGRGSIQLKCEAPSSTFSAGCLTSLRLAACKGTEEIWGEMPRGPITHDFALSGICGLLPGEDQWDFRRLTDAASTTFIAYVQIVPPKALAANTPSPQ